MRSEERRESLRHPRRIQVRYWVDGEPASTAGVTGNLSLRGAFVTSHKVYPRGTRLRLELSREGGAVVIEGEVAHAHRVPVELRALGTSGMGVRFLPPQDLVAPLLPVEMLEPEPPPDQAGSPAVYGVTFEDLAAFLLCYRRDLVNGGIFVHTDHPREVRSLIELEFRFPGRTEVLTARGRVVQVIGSSEAARCGAPTRGGMGVELLALEALLAELRPLVERLEG